MNKIIIGNYSYEIESSNNNSCDGCHFFEKRINCPKKDNTEDGLCLSLIEEGIDAIFINKKILLTKVLERL